MPKKNRRTTTSEHNTEILLAVITVSALAVIITAMIIQPQQILFIPVVGVITTPVSGLFLCAKCDGPTVQYQSMMGVAGQNCTQTCDALTLGGAGWDYIRMFEEGQGQNRWNQNTWTVAAPDPECIES